MSIKSKILIIAGSDSCGGAGIQIDIRTAAHFKTHAAAVITCLTAQNTQGVSAIYVPPIEFLEQQLNSVFDDIKFDAIKIGMLFNAEIISCVADILEKRAKKIPVILDTVMVATSGDLLLKQDAIELLKSRLFRDVFLVTPNIDEAEVLAEMKIENLDDMKRAALKIQTLGVKNILIKGGHINLSAKKIINLLLDEKGKFHLITNNRVKINKIHGTGCSLASAIACNIARKIPLVKAIKNANQYVFKAIKKSPKIGAGSHILGLV